MIILSVIQILIILLFIASLVGIAIKKFNVPYTITLVVVGSLMGIASPVFGSEFLNISAETFRDEFIPEVILALLVPPLVFEAAFHLQWNDLRRELPIIFTFAIPGVILTTLLVAAVVAAGSSLAFSTALVLGALLAATDPVAVVALFGALGVPKRLRVLVEGESLFNDGTAVVIFGLVLTVATTGEFDLASAAGEFFEVALGGLVIGLGIGLGISRIVNRVDDHLIEISLTIVAAYGAFLLAEHFHFAGVLAVVAAGVVMGNIGPNGMSEATQEKLLDFWEYLAFAANSFVFLVIGLLIEFDLVLANLDLIALAIFAVLLARAAVIYGLASFFRQLSFDMKHVLYWGGLRGAISLALVLSLTHDSLGDSLSLIEAMAYGVVLFTLIVQGLSMERLLTWLQFIGVPDQEAT